MPCQIDKAASIAAFLCVVALLIIIYTAFAYKLEHALTESLSKSEMLNEALERERKARQTQANFIANMSHEIRTPMNGIMGLVNVVLDGDLDTNQREYLSQVKYSGAALKHILDDILDYSKLSAGKISLEMKPSDIRVLVKEQINLFSAAAKSKELNLESKLDAQLSQYHLADALKIAQVLSNLLSNAIKFSSSGAVKLSIEVLKDTQNQQQLRFAVKDEGIGIDERQQQRIFDAFTQADESISRSYGGTGLGLQISKVLVDKMGGTMTVNSALTQGSCFSFQLSLDKTSSQPSANQQIDIQSHDSLQGKILLVDDNDINLMVVKEMLKHTQIQVFTAKDGLEAIGAAKRSSFDLILMDISMPNMTGIEAAEHIRKSGKTVPIIALSAAAFEDDIAASKAAGMEKHLSKPIEKALLLNTIAAYLQKESEST